MQTENRVREHLLKEYAIDENGRIKTPGKFEGESIFVPHLWSLAMDGFADEDDGEFYMFRFAPDDSDPLIQQFPELKKHLGRHRIIRLREDGQGFVWAMGY
jgi:hypothetical protein